MGGHFAQFSSQRYIQCTPVLDIYMYKPHREAWNVVWNDFKGIVEKDEPCKNG